MHSCFRVVCVKKKERGFSFFTWPGTRLGCLVSLSPFRRIVIPDVEEGVFRTYLQFLYGCTLDVAAMAMEELMDLLAVADK